MLRKLLFCGMITLITTGIGSNLEVQAVHKNGLINKFCIASLKSKINLKDKLKSHEISNYTCECFLKKYESGYSIKRARIYCRNKAAEKYNL